MDAVRSSQSLDLVDPLRGAADGLSALGNACGFSMSSLSHLHRKPIATPFKILQYQVERHVTQAPAGINRSGQDLNDRIRLVKEALEAERITLAESFQSTRVPRPSVGNIENADSE